MIDVTNYPQLLAKELAGKVDFMKCNLCKGIGYINYEDEGNDIISGESKNLNRINKECSNCEGLGFVVKEF
ncbi:MAG: hypothetical protein M0R17_01280 [Candidatus Omnitrophica bacterium]|jgi:hypothetical protein|nr:hypothetical protein [Candidatus Omnitrophota bacterium]